MQSEASPSTAVAEPQPKEGIQPGLEARAAAIGAVAETKAKLGELAAGKEVHATSDGVILTDKEYKHDVLGKVA